MRGRSHALPILLLSASLLACGSGTSPTPSDETRTRKQTKEDRKDLTRARRKADAREQNVTGGVELAAFAQELQGLIVAGDLASVQALFLDPAAVAGCTFMRAKTSEPLSPSEVGELFLQRRARLDRLRTPLPGASVVALVHKVRARKRLMGARIGGDTCPIEARGRVNVVLRGAAPPPDAVENRFETAYVAGRWWAVSYERAERDCSDLGAPEAFGCRALRSSGGPLPDEPDDESDG